MSPRKVENRRLLQGNEAVAEGAIYAGCRFFAGYPITPASEISEVLALQLPRIDGTFIQMEDEIAGMGAIIGASLAGLKSMTATSGPGFSLMQENLGYACIAETPCVVVNVMRRGALLHDIGKAIDRELEGTHALLGAELALVDYLSLYAEYNLLLSIDEPLFMIDLGIGNGAQVGLVVYLP